MKVSPFGLCECCICDAPATVAIPTESKELLPYCNKCAKDMKVEFPDSQVLLISR